MASDVNQFCGDVNPAMFARLMWASSVTKLVAAGFDPMEVGSFGANVYTPPVVGEPENAWRLEQLVHGYAGGSEEIGIPIGSGKDSSSGRFTIKESNTKIDAPLTLDILALGRMRDASRIIRKPFVKAGDLILLFRPGLYRAELGGSILYDVHAVRGDKLCKVDLRRLRHGLENYHILTRGSKPIVRSRSAIGEGGLARRLFECSLGSDLGCEIYTGLFEPMELLFAETHGSIMFTVSPGEWSDLWHVDADVIGHVTEVPNIKVFGAAKEVLFDVPIDELAVGWSKTFAGVVR